MTTAQIGSGNVEVIIGNEPLQMTPTWIAAQQISRQYGGISPAIEAVLKVDLDAIVFIVQLGLGYGPQRAAPQDLPEKIWRAGVTDDTGRLIQQTIRYLRVLSSGGRPPPETPAPTDGERPTTAS